MDHEKPHNHSRIVALVSMLPLQGHHFIRSLFHRGRAAARRGDTQGRAAYVEELRDEACGQLANTAVGVLAVAENVYFATCDNMGPLWITAAYAAGFALVTSAVSYTQLRLARTIERIEPLPSDAPREPIHPHADNTPPTKVETVVTYAASAVFAATVVVPPLVYFM